MISTSSSSSAGNRAFMQPVKSDPYQTAFHAADMSEPTEPLARLLTFADRQPVRFVNAAALTVVSGPTFDINATALQSAGSVFHPQLSL